MLKLLKCLRTSIINFLTEKIMFQGYEGTLLTFKVWWIAWPLLVAFSTWCLRCPFAELVLLFRDEHSTNDEQRRWRNKKTTANIKKTNAEKKGKTLKKWYFSVVSTYLCWPMLQLFQQFLRFLETLPHQRSSQPVRS